MFLIRLNNGEYLSCSTKFDNNYNLISITHNIKINDSLLSISLC